MRVLDTDEPCPRLMNIPLANGLPNILRIHGAHLPDDGAWLRPCDHADPCHLIIKDVRLCLDNHFIPALGPCGNGYLISLCTTRDKERRFLSEHIRGQFFQPANRWIFSIYVIAHLGLRHKTTHLFSWLCY